MAVIEAIITVISEISEVFSSELKWSSDELESQQNFLRSYIEKELSWRKKFI